MKNIHIIRRMVATMANRLKKMGLTLSAAFNRVTGKYTERMSYGALITLQLA